VALEPWIVGVIIGGAVLALILVGVAPVCIIKRRGARKVPANNPAAAEMNLQPLSTYAVIPAKSSQYDNGRMKNIDGVAAASEYNIGRLS
jgi:hypothetical protein